MKKDQDAARLEAVCARHGIPVPQNDADWKPLAMALMAAHEPEFKPPRKRIGRPPKLSAFERLLFSLLIVDVMLDKKLSQHKACEYVWRDVLRGNERGFQAFRKSISAFLKTPEQEFTDNETLKTELLRGLAKFITKATLAIKSNPSRKAKIGAALKLVLERAAIIPDLDFLGKK
ncbi:MAG: hypothetical protein WAN43_00270 [Rhodomicrobium sp.]